MTPEELEKKQKEIIEGISKEVNESISKKGFITKTELEEMVGKTTQSVTEVKQILDQMGISVKELQNGKEFVVKSQSEQLDDELKRVLPEIQKQLAQKSGFSGHLNIKEVGTSSVGSSTMAYRLPDIGVIPYKGMVMEPLFNTFDISGEENTGGKIVYLDQHSITRGAAERLEGGSYSASDIDWVEYSEDIKNVGDIIKVREESLNNFGFIRNEIQNLLSTNMSLKVDTQLYSGNGVGANLKGLTTQATEFDYAAEATAGNIFVNCGIMQLIGVIKTRIGLGKEGKYNPNIVMMNPMDVLKLRYQTDNEGNFINQAWAMGAPIPGIIESSTVTANTMLVFDSRYPRLYNKQGFALTTGYINDDFNLGKINLRVSRRLAAFVRNADLDCMRKVSDISTAINALKAS